MKKPPYNHIIIKGAMIEKIRFLVLLITVILLPLPHGTAAESKPSFRSKADVRINNPEQFKGYVALFGGINIDQETIDTYDSGAGAAIGIKGGYSFPVHSEKWVTIQGVVEAEMFYNGYEDELDSGVFSVNPLLKFDFNFPVRPYVGFGIGGAVLTTEVEDEDAITLAVQGIGGAEIDFKEHWSLFTEYKFLHFADLSIAGRQFVFDNDSISNHLLVGGARYHF